MIGSTADPDPIQPTCKNIYRLDHRGNFELHFRRVINMMSYVFKGHRHPGLELLYIRSGQGVFISGAHASSFEAPAIIYFEPTVHHRVEVTGDYDRYNIVFDFDFFTKCKLNLGAINPPRTFVGNLDGVAVISIPQQYVAWFDTIFQAIMSEVYEWSPVSRHLVALKLAEIMLLCHKVREADLCKHRSSIPHPSMSNVLAHIAANPKRDWTVDDVARVLGYSKSHTYRLIREETGTSLSRYLMERRVARAKELLVGSAMPITDVAVAVGITDLSRFCRTFRAVTGESATAYRTLAHSAEAAAAQGCASVSLGDGRFSRWGEGRR